MRLQLPRLNGADLAFSVAGTAATLLIAYLAVSQGAKVSVGLLFAAVMFLGAVVAFIAYPHFAVAGTIALFAVVPMLKVFVAPEIGPIKDVVVFAAVIAAAVIFIFDRRPIDRWLLMLVSGLLAIYLINIGTGHGIAWLQGVRLVAEPLLLLLVGLILPEPRRTFRYAMGALIVVASVVAFYGIAQQLIGKFTLVEWGYEFEAQVRTLSNGQLRSFGTLDDPFSYAALLIFGIVGVFFWLRRGPAAWAAALLILLGLAASLTRTSTLILVGLFGLVLARWSFTSTAVLAMVATAVASGAILVSAGGSQAQVYSPGGTAESAESAGAANVILNGRISAWQIALGDNPGQWMFGRGVGVVGTAAERADFTIAPVSESSGSIEEEAVDSGYLAVIADVGIAGLLVLLALLGRLIYLAFGAARRGTSAGWVALGILVALLLDALTRSSFTGFPTAFLGLLLIGIALAAAQEEEVATPRSVRAAGP